MIDKVYIITIHYHYDNTEIDSVYINKEAAVKRYDELETSEQFYRNTSVSIFLDELEISE
jgi:hypothetical protein